MNKAEKIYEKHIGLNQELGYKPVQKEDVLSAIKEALTHGGKRPNAGRKSQYKEETQTISFRVPKSLIEPIRLKVKQLIASIK